MAKVVITVADVENDDIDLTVDFDPPTTDADNLTPAQSAALAMVMPIIERFAGEGNSEFEHVDGSVDTL